MPVKPYEINAELFKQIEPIYDQFGRTELVKVNFLYQILIESGLFVDVELGDEVYFKILLDEKQLNKWLATDTVKVAKIEQLGFKFEQGKVRIK
jgi:hypothetical protein